MEKLSFDITGMTCAACSARVEKAANGVEGVERAVVNLLKNSMELEYDGEAQTVTAVCTAIEKAGYGATPRSQGDSSSAQSAADAKAAKENAANKAAAQVRMRLIVSFVFTIPLFYLSMGHMFDWPLPPCFIGMENMLIVGLTQFLLLIPVLFVNRRFFTNGFKTLFHGNPTMDTLIALGSTASTVYGIAALYRMSAAFGVGDLETAHMAGMDMYFESAGMILTLITLGKYFEARAKGHTTDAITALMDLAPKTAHLVLDDGTMEDVAVDKLQVGDILAVKAGESIPADGVVVQGMGTVDESALTGESVPVDKAKDDEVTGATFNTSGYFTMQVKRVGDDTALAQIIKLVDDATSSKAPIQRIADKISGVFVPIVIAIAVVVFIVWMALTGGDIATAINHAISILVISCPCAMGLATPTAIMVGTGRGAKMGILIKSAEALETAHDLKTVVLDKTGTITKGEPEVTDVLVADGVERDELLTLACALEAKSEHPLARAVCGYCAAHGIDELAVQGFEQVPGQGLRARFASQEVLGGNAVMMQACGISLGGYESMASELANNGKTPLFFAYAGALVGVLAVADAIKPSSAVAVRELSSLGIKTVMLTGDNERTAQAVAAQIGVDEVISGVLPAGKEEAIRRFGERGKVAMVGDGINDAPALARGDVGFAIGAGTDIAIESADFVLMRSDLKDVSAGIQLSRATMRNIKQNLFWALFYNVICIPVAAGILSPLGVTLNPMIAAAAMSCSSICVVSNALRLRAWKPKSNIKES